VHDGALKVGSVGVLTDMTHFHRQRPRTTNRLDLSGRQVANGRSAREPDGLKMLAGRPGLVALNRVGTRFPLG
jgi:hypothetical protein